MKYYTIHLTPEELRLFSLTQTDKGIKYSFTIDAINRMLAELHRLIRHEVVANCADITPDFKKLKAENLAKDRIISYYQTIEKILFSVGG